MHRCDNPSCCRPDHLEIGTIADNVADRVAKGRSARGSRSGTAKLTESKVKKILKSRKSAKQLADQFGVDFTLIHLIWKRKIWKHVEGERNV